MWAKPISWLRVAALLARTLQASTASIWVLQRASPLAPGVGLAGQRERPPQQPHAAGEQDHQAQQGRCLADRGRRCARACGRWRCARPAAQPSVSAGPAGRSCRGDARPPRPSGAGSAGARQPPRSAVAAGPSPARPRSPRRASRGRRTGQQLPVGRLRRRPSRAARRSASPSAPRSRPRRPRTAGGRSPRRSTGSRARSPPGPGSCACSCATASCGVGGRPRPARRRRRGSCEATRLAIATDSSTPTDAASQSSAKRRIWAEMRSRSRTARPARAAGRRWDVMVTTSPRGRNGSIPRRRG